MALEIKDNDWLAKSYYGLGYCSFYKRNYSLAINLTKEAIKYAKRSGNEDILSKGYAQLGRYYALKNDYAQALKEFHHSLDISESKEELNNNTVSVLTSIGEINLNEKDTVEALKHYYKAKTIGEKSPSTRLGNVYNNLGILYMGSQMDSALLYFQKALKSYEVYNYKQGEILARQNIATTILNFKSKKDYEDAYNQLTIAMNQAIKLNDPESLFFANYFMGVYYETAIRDNSKAKSFYQKSWELFKKGYRNEYAVQLYKSLSRISEKLGDFESAYEFQKTAHKLQDSVFSVEKNKQFHEIQTKFDVEQKNNRIKLLNKENEIKSKQNMWIFISGVILVIFLIIIAYIYRKEARSQKVIRKQDLLLFRKEKESIEHQQKLNEIKFLIAGQNQERSRVSKELHDGIGSSLAAMKINLSLLNEREVKNKQLNHHIDQLNDITKEIRIISHALSVSTDSGKSMEELINDLVEIHQLNKGFKLHLTLFPEDCLNGLTEFEKTNLYRVFQEIFANISRHSQATKVEVNCILDEANLTIMIEDNGVGFEEGDHSGIGLKNIKERIKELKGEVSIDSVPNHGTTISISLSKNKQE